MLTLHSKWMPRVLAGMSILTITGVVYAGNCHDLQLHTEHCGETQSVYGLDCSYWNLDGPEPVFVSCPNQLLYQDTRANVHVCLSGQSSGGTDCQTCGDKVKATRQHYTCSEFSCTVVPDGDPETLEECCTAKLIGVCTST